MQYKHNHEGLVYLQIAFILWAFYGAKEGRDCNKQPYMSLINESPFQ